MAAVAAVWNNVVAYAWRHPMARHNPVGAYCRIAMWQVRSRTTRGLVVTPWINDTKLALKAGQSGATGNLYYGLHEYADMAFFGHFLRNTDVFADVGANVGSYTVLAAGVAGANVLAFEPVPATAAALADNVVVNGIADKVTVRELALGRSPGAARFTSGLDAMNRFAGANDGAAIKVTVDTADSQLAGKGVVAMKVDVEGAEADVFAAAGKLLTEDQLVAIELETIDPGVRQTIERAGFVEAWYDPRDRSLSSRPNGLGQNNHLFLRNRDFVAQRLRSAAPLRFRRITV